MFSSVSPSVRVTSGVAGDDGCTGQDPVEHRPRGVQKPGPVGGHISRPAGDRRIQDDVGDEEDVLLLKPSCYNT